MAEATHSGRGLWEDRIRVGMDGERVGSPGTVRPTLGTGNAGSAGTMEEGGEQVCFRYFGDVLCACNKLGLRFVVLGIHSGL